jgi:hypothetical protein
VKLANTVIAGVNKAGTTGLYVALASHRQVAPSAVKETKFFLPLRYGRSLPPIEEYAAYFDGAGDEPVRLEATPAYFYGGEALARGMQDALGDPRAIVVLREPVSRFVSFFEYQKVRLRIPESMPIEEYLSIADRLDRADFADPENEKYFAFYGGCYADDLPAWLQTYGDRLRIVFLDDMVADPQRTLRELATWLAIDPHGYTIDRTDAENKTVAFKNRGLQRLALYVNDRSERFLRRHHGLKQRMRALYFRFNGKAEKAAVSDGVRAELAARYREPNERLAAQLVAAGVALPPWLQPAGADAGSRAPSPTA